MTTTLAAEPVELAAHAQMALEAIHHKATKGIPNTGVNLMHVPLMEEVASIKDKIYTIATKVYGAKDVEYDIKARRQVAQYERMGYGGLPICMAKTQYSFSHNASLIGAPSGWTLPVREVELVAGAGFILPLAGTINRMPGLGATPAAHSIDIDDEGEVVGLS